MHIAPTSFLLWLGIGIAAIPIGSASLFASEPERKPGSRVIGLAVGVALATGLAGALVFASSVYSRKGGDYVKFGRWTEAQWLYERSDLVDWNDRREMFFIASMLFQRGEYAASIPLFEKELKRNPYYMDGYANLGSALGAAGDIAGAEKALRRASELNPAYAEAYANLGVALLQQKRKLEAAAAFSQALELEPGILMAQRGLEQALGGVKKEKQ